MRGGSDGHTHFRFSQEKLEQKDCDTGEKEAKQPDQTGRKEEEVYTFATKRIRNHLGGGAKEEPSQVFQENEETDGDHDDVDVCPPIEEGPEQESLHEETDDAHSKGSNDQGSEPACPSRNEGNKVDRTICAQHRKIAMGEVRDLHDPEDHRQTDRNQTVDASNDQSIKDLL